MTERTGCATASPLAVCAGTEQFAALSAHPSELQHVREFGRRLHKSHGPHDMEEGRWSALINGGTYCQRSRHTVAPISRELTGQRTSVTSIGNTYQSGNGSGDRPGRMRSATDDAVTRSVPFLHAAGRFLERQPVFGGGNTSSPLDDMEGRNQDRQIPARYNSQSWANRSRSPTKT
jgi:hypothetical protein